MSSRSLLAARSRRAGENPPPVSGNRPGTSIGSHAAFAPQPQGYQTNMPQPPPNVRVSKAMQPVQQQQPGQQRGQPQTSNNMPFSKLSVSDAIGLITIRLGRVEQLMQNSEEQFQFNGSENGEMMDKDLINSLTERIYNLENKPSNNNLNIDSVKNQITLIEKELINLKEILKTHTNKVAGFMAETEQKFLDVDAAFVELEKNVEIENVEIQMDENELLDGENVKSSLNIENVQLIIQDDKDDKDEKEEKGPTFTTIDLKNMINEELASVGL